uniref:Disks large 1 n=1 Tax=Aceria tosichella TaxID=561515 RepID=A0A6G1SIV6_9ACAR
MLHFTTSTTAAAGLPSHHDEFIGNINAGPSATSRGNLSANEQTNDHNDAIQSSSTPWEYEEITIERGPSGLGFTVAGGIDNPHYKNDNSIYITRLIPNGPAHLDGRLKLDDIIVRVNDTDLTDVKHSEAVLALKSSGTRVQLLIKRRKSSSITHNLNNNSLSNDNKNLSYISKQRQQQASHNTPRLFTSSVSSTQPPSNQLPQLPRAAQSGPAILRGSAQYSTTRESGTSNRAPKLKNASSSLSLQQTDEVDTSRIYSLFKENVSSGGHSRSTSAIDFDTNRSLTRLPRTVILQRTQKGLGFNIVGGVAGGGTFISYIVPGGAAERSNKLHCGDQVLSVNGVDLRLATHEEAASALKQAGQTVKLVVKYRPEEYIKFENKINDLRERNMLSSGTLQTSQKRSLYARALFDYDPSKDSGLPSKGLPFKFGDILHIINASDDEWWQAKKVLDNGQDDIVHGIIPSKKRIEKRERARLKSVKFTHRNSSESTLDRRRKKFTFSKRFPFMKSRENVGLEEYDLLGSQTNSRGILSSSSTTSINNNSERGSIRNFNEEIILSYEPVLQQNINYVRPVALYGPVKDEIEGLREDLSCDERFYKMESIVPYTTRPPKEGEIDGVKYHFVSIQEMKRDLANHRFVEAGELNHHLYGTSIDSIREVAESGKHCLLNISPKAIKRLHDANIYPIIIFIKPRSLESLLEMNKRWSHEEAAAAMDYANRLEQEFGTYFTATIQQDTPNEVLREIMNVISQQSGPRIWIPTTFEALNVA